MKVTGSAIKSFPLCTMYCAHKCYRCSSTMIINTRHTRRHHTTETRLSRHPKINYTGRQMVLAHHVKSPMLIKTIVKCRKKFCDLRLISYPPITSMVKSRVRRDVPPNPSTTFSKVKEHRPHYQNVTYSSHECGTWRPLMGHEKQWTNNRINRRTGVANR